MRVAFLLLLLAASPAFASELVEPVAPLPKAAPVFAAGFWCPLVRGGDEPQPCDGGMAAGLRWRRIAGVALVGKETVGVGIAFRIAPKVGVGVGYVYRWALDGGVDTRTGSLVVGATFRP